MKLNMSVPDRLVRLLIAIVITVLYYTNVLTGVWAYVFVLIACLLLATAIVGICPVYSIFGINTQSKHDKRVHNQ
ncbi:MAG: DUF2892 domain-containing protein [Candidatus Dadabacteria bacterium]